MISVLHYNVRNSHFICSTLLSPLLNIRSARNTFHNKILQAAQRRSPNVFTQPTRISNESVSIRVITHGLLFIQARIEFLGLCIFCRRMQRPDGGRLHNYIKASPENRCIKGWWLRWNGWLLANIVCEMSLYFGCFDLHLFQL